MFKNLLIHRIQPEWQPELLAAEQALQAQRFVPCGSTQPQSAGWVPPRGDDHGPLIESVAGQWMLTLQVEQRLLPGPVVRQRTEEIAAQIEQSTGRKPGKKQTRELKEQAMLELLPRAFTRQFSLKVWIDPQARLMLLDCGSAKRAEEVVTLLVKAWPQFAAVLLQTRTSPAVAMSHWLSTGEAPAGFSVDRECELKSPDATKAVVRYTRHALDIDEIREHITAGKQPTRLAMTWAGRVGFTLTEQLQLKKLAFDDVVFEVASASDRSADASFDTDVAISTGELSRLLPDLVEALDGELQPGELPDALAAEAAAPASAAETVPAKATQAEPKAQPAAGDDDSPPWA